MTISDKIKASGVTDKIISESTGLPIPTIWRWRTGKTTPNVKHVRALAVALGCKPDALIP